MFGYIYKTTNLLNGKIYIGKKCSEEFEGNKYLGSGIALSGAVSKYGRENFKVELIDTAECLEELNEKEKHFIKLYNSRDEAVGYNIAPGGDGGCVWGDPKNHPTLGYNRSGENNGAFGRKWYNNGVQTIYLKPDDKVPEGFHPGTLRKPGLNKIRIYSPENEIKVVSQESVEKFLRLGWITAKQKQELKRSEVIKSREEIKHKKAMEKEKKKLERQTSRAPRKSWCKGLTKETDERVRKIAEKKLGNTYSLGKKRSEITKRRISESRKGYKPTPQTIAKISETCMNRTQEERKIISEHCSQAQKRLCWVTDGVQTLRVRVDDVDGYYARGFIRGRTMNNADSKR